MVGKQSTTSKTDYKFTREYLAEDTYAEIKPLLHDHWKEIAVSKDKIKLSPDIETYYKLQELDKLFCLICRNKGKMVGYIITMLHEHPHYVDHIFAQNDLFYLMPQYRKGLLAFKFLKEHEKQIKNLGVSCLLYHIKPDKDFSKILTRTNYTLFETVYKKDLI